jgi:putative iron-only hydrogenase system regulator
MEESMEERVALIGIVVEKYDSAERLNQILHEYGKYIIGRMGIPYKEKSMNIISVAVDAPMDIISTLSGKLGMLDGVTTKTIYAKSKR